MNIVVSHRPSYAVATAMLGADESIVAEAGAMISMDPHIQISTFATASHDEPQRRGCLGALFAPFRRLLGGESFYQNRYVSQARPGSVSFAPSIPGDIAVTEIMNEQGLILQNSAFLCSDPGVSIDTRWGGAKAFLASEGVYMLRAFGDGLIAFNSFGAIREIAVDKRYVVDSGHVVAFEDSLDYDIRAFSRGVWKALFGGEALVVEFSGAGKVWVQSRNRRDWGRLIGPQLPRRLR